MLLRCCASASEAVRLRYFAALGMVLGSGRGAGRRRHACLAPKSTASGGGGKSPSIRHVQELRRDT